MRLEVSRLMTVICHGSWVVFIPCRQHWCGTHLSGRFKHLFHGKIATTTVYINKYNFYYFYFKPVQKHGDEQSDNYIFPVCCGNLHNVEHHTNYNHRQSMTPSKLDDFLRSIQSMLKFVNGRYLHDDQQFYLISIE